MRYIMNQLKQESTWRGIIALLMGVGITLEPSQQEAIIAGGLALIGIINVFKKD